MTINLNLKYSPLVKLVTCSTFQQNWFAIMLCVGVEKNVPLLHSALREGGEIAGQRNNM